MRHKEGVSYQISNNFIIFCNQLTPSIVNIFFTKTTFTYFDNTKKIKTLLFIIDNNKYYKYKL